MAYKLTHPASNQTVEVDADQVAMYQSQGWETKRGVKAPAAPPAQVVDERDEPADTTP